MFSLRTDLALEAGEIIKEQNPDNPEIMGVKSKTFEDNFCTVTEVIIENDEVIGKPKGTYITIEADCIIDNNITAFNEISERVKKELSKLIGDTENKTVLLAGLGNRDITPDSIGPKVLSQILVTRHIFSNLPEFSGSFNPVCAVTPGVLGVTGIETAELLKGIVDRISPDIIIVIDALAARKISRISRTIQMSDSGIVPGSGVLNSRKALNSQTLGIPTICIGVPMVVDAATMLLDCLNETENNKENHTQILEKILNKPSYMICPKDVDAQSDRISAILANGINMALQNKLSLEEIFSLTK